MKPLKPQIGVICISEETSAELDKQPEVTEVFWLHTEVIPDSSLVPLPAPHGGL